jgi:hypothetical protein
MKEEKDFAGKNGFVWWVGFVEDRKDPLKLGRCKIRCIGWHAEDKMRLPTEDLPWATPAYPPNNTNTYAPKEGDMCFGFFVDGENIQEPILLGIFPSIPLKQANPQEAFSDPRKSNDLSSAPRPPKSKEYKTDGTGIVITEEPEAKNNPINLDEPTTSRLARNDPEFIEKTFIQERKDNVVKDIKTFNKNTELSSWNEPETKYKTQYPYNNVNETESGHLIEFDDTPGFERIHMAHRNGSFNELYPDGDKVEKITKDNYQIVMKDDHLYVMGKVKITVQGDAEVYVKKNLFARVDENVTAFIKGNVDAEVEGNVNAKINGNASFDVGGDYNIQAANFTVNAGTINLN